MTRPRRCPRCGHDHDYWMADLCSGAGGAGTGYHRAGLGVVGVDIEPQPNYPFEFHQADMMTFPLEEFDAIHASPPCHDHSNVSGRNRKASGAKGTGWMLDAAIARLRLSGLPFVVENVGTAKFPPDVYRIRLCGSSFSLDVERHRWFASNLLILQPQCAHYLQAPRFRMTPLEITQAIPPAYTEHIGRQLIEHLMERAA